MKKILAILFSVISFSCYGQITTTNLGTLPTIDTIGSRNNFRFNGVGRLPAYSSPDTTTVLGVDMNGFLVRRHILGSPGSYIANGTIPQNASFNINGLGNFGGSIRLINSGANPTYDVGIDSNLMLFTTNYLGSNRQFFIGDVSGLNSIVPKHTLGIGVTDSVADIAYFGLRPNTALPYPVNYWYYPLTDTGSLALDKQVKDTAAALRALIAGGGYILASPGTQQSAFINITGNITTGSTGSINAGFNVTAGNDFVAGNNKGYFFNGGTSNITAATTNPITYSSVDAGHAGHLFIDSKSDTDVAFGGKRASVIKALIDTNGNAFFNNLSGTNTGDQIAGWGLAGTSTLVVDTTKLLPRVDSNIFKGYVTLPYLETNYAPATGGSGYIRNEAAYPPQAGSSFGVDGLSAAYAGFITPYVANPSNQANNIVVGAGYIAFSTSPNGEIGRFNENNLLIGTSNDDGSGAALQTTTGLSGQDNTGSLTQVFFIGNDGANNGVVMAASPLSGLPFVPSAFMAQTAYAGSDTALDNQNYAIHLRDFNTGNYAHLRLPFGGIASPDEDYILPYVGGILAINNVVASATISDAFSEAASTPANETILSATANKASDSVYTVSAYNISTSTTTGGLNSSISIRWTDPSGQNNNATFGSAGFALNGCSGYADKTIAVKKNTTILIRISYGGGNPAATGTFTAGASIKYDH